MQDARTRWALAAIGLVIFGGSGVALYATRRTAPPPVVITMPPLADRRPASNSGGIGVQYAAPVQEAAPIQDATSVPPVPVHQVAPVIYVHVAGAVRHPSLYTLAPGSRVMQAIKAAGGPAAKADLDAINLAEKVRDGEKVYVPVQQPQAVMVEPPGNTIGHASVIPADDTGTDNSVPSSAPDTPPAPVPNASKTAKHGGLGKADKLTSPSQGQVNLNTADAGQLQRLPGIGPAMAARILAYREQAHGFQKIDELMEVGGIGPKKFAKISPLVKLN